MENYCPLCNHELPRSKGTFVDNESGQILLDGQVVTATRQTRLLLGALVEKSPRTITKGYLMDHLYGLESEKDEPGDKIIDVFIVRARKAIKDSNYEIVTEWGRGWKFRQKVLHNGREENERNSSEI